MSSFAGKARISEAFAKRGRGVLQPRDILGHDLRDTAVQEEILRDIGSHRPGLLWVAPPCTLWCGFSKLNYSRQELRRLRGKEMALIHFVDRAMKLQNELGGLVTGGRRKSQEQRPVANRDFPESLEERHDLCES